MPAQTNTHQPIIRLALAAVVLGGLMLGLLFSAPALATPRQQSDREALLRQAAQAVFAENLPPDKSMEIGLTRIEGDWALVNARLRLINDPDPPEWEVQLALARWEDGAWQIAPEGSPQFPYWLEQLPAVLIAPEARPYLLPDSPQAANAPGLWLPFPVGQTWKYIAGPNGGPRREAVDFGPFGPTERPRPDPTPAPPLTGQERDVTAAAAGVVVDRNRNMLILRHSGPEAWETGYYSLAADSISHSVGDLILQGQRLGATSPETEPEKGSHVHFWVRRAGVDQGIDGQVLSDWRVHQDNGYLVGQNAGRLVYRDGQERVDCLSAERANLPPERCHVKHLSPAPSPLPLASVSIQPTGTLTIPLHLTGSREIAVTTSDNLYRARLRVTYSPPAALSVVDAFPGTPGIQVAPGDVFQNVPLAIIQNQVDPVNGVITFEAERQPPAPAFNGSGALIDITWRREAVGPGSVMLDPTEVELFDSNGLEIPVQTALTGTGVVTISTAFVLQGQVQLQGRDTAGGTKVRISGEEVAAQADGQFQVGTAGPYRLTVDRPGYLQTQVEGNPGPLPAGVDYQVIELGQISLLAGDANDDGLIDILDLALVGNRLGSDDAAADINGDGRVDIFDLALVAANFGQQAQATTR